MEKTNRKIKYHGRTRRLFRKNGVYFVKKGKNFVSVPWWETV